MILRQGPCGPGCWVQRTQIGSNLETGVSWRHRKSSAFSGKDKARPAELSGNCPIKVAVSPRAFATVQKHSTTSRSEFRAPRTPWGVKVDAGLTFHRLRALPAAACVSGVRRELVTPPPPASSPSFCSFRQEEQRGSERGSSAPPSRHGCLRLPGATGHHGRESKSRVSGAEHTQVWAEGWTDRDGGTDR